MNRLPLVASFAAAALVAALAPANVRVALAAPAPSASPTIAPTDVPTATPTPEPTPRPHHLTVTPVPLRPKLPRPSPKPTPSPSPTPSLTPSPSPSPSPAGKAPHATAAPKPSATPQAAATSTPSPAPTATPSPKPTRAPRVSPSRKASPTPPPEAQTASPETITIPTPEPTARPTPPAQPTVPQSLADPGVQNTLHRNIRELAQLGWLAGTWRAHSFTDLGDGRSRDAGMNTYVFGLTLHNRWFFGADGKASDFLYITYDPFAHHWVLLRFQDNPSYGIWLSDAGWKGNRIVFESSFSTANGRQYHRRLTIIHKDARDFGLYDEEQLPNGSWTSDDAIELTKIQ